MKGVFAILLILMLRDQSLSIIAMFCSLTYNLHLFGLALRLHRLMLFRYVSLSIAVSLWRVFSSVKYLFEAGKFSP